MTRLQAERLQTLAMQARVLADILEHRDSLNEEGSVERSQANQLANGLETLDWEVNNGRLW